MSFFNSNYSGKGITNSQVVTEEGKYAIDAAQNNPDIEGSLRNSINNISDKIDSQVIDARNDFQTTSKTGYINLVKIKITATHANYPLKFTVNGRGFKKPVNLLVLFNNTDSIDPGIDNYTYDTQPPNHNFYIAKEEAGTWSIYINHAPWENITVTKAEIIRALTTGWFSVTYPNILLDALPDGSLEFTQET